MRRFHKRDQLEEAKRVTASIFTVKVPKHLMFWGPVVTEMWTPQGYSRIVKYPPRKARPEK